MFKLAIICVLVAAASAANRFGNSGQHHQAAHSAVTSDDVHAEVNSLTSDVRPDGFQYAFDTTNGISAAAAGDAYGSANGNFAWSSPEGVPVGIQYVADENGYQPSGDLLPTPPPIPAAILKSLEYIRAHPPQEVRVNNGRRF